MWSAWAWVRMTMSTSCGNTPICLKDVLTIDFMYLVLGSTTMRWSGVRMSTDVEFATRIFPSPSRSRFPTARMSS